VVPTDPDVDHVIATALASTADLIASGDKRDLLPMGAYAGIPHRHSQGCSCKAWRRLNDLTIEPMPEQGGH
jgi:hypothetical protein